MVEWCECEANQQTGGDTAVSEQRGGDLTSQKLISISKKSVKWHRT